MRSILFVDDESRVLEGLQRMLFPMQREWKMAFALSGAQALELLEKGHFDVVVSDMRMPGMDGAQLLEEVKKRCPDTLRFILSGQSESEVIYRTLGSAHQFLSKPCKPAFLKECVDKAFALRSILASDALKAVVAQIGTLPPVPQVYAKLCEALKSPDCTIEEVGQVIKMDPAMTAKILQVTNSAFFGLRRDVSTVPQAVSLIGLKNITALVLARGLFAPVEGGKLPPGFSIDSLWRHCMVVASYAQAICQVENTSKEIADDAYTGGLLHDTGQLVFLAGCPDDYVRCHEYAIEKQVTLPAAEGELLQCTHGEVGAYLLGIWGLPYPIVESVAYHHNPSIYLGSEFSPVTAVHVADILAFKRRSDESDSPHPGFDMPYLERLGLSNHIPEWDKACDAIDAQEGEKS